MSVPHLDDVAVTASMDACSEVAAVEGDVVDWSVSTDLVRGSWSPGRRVAVAKCQKYKDYKGPRKD